MLPAKNDQVLEAIRFFLYVAEYAAGHFGLDEFGTPGSPEALHMLIVAEFAMSEGLNQTVNEVQ